MTRGDGLWGITAACQKLKIGHVTLYGPRSYFVTQARQSGLKDAEIAMLLATRAARLSSLTLTATSGPIIWWRKPSACG